MVFSEFFIKIPYSIAWRLYNASNNPFPVVFYCTDYIDYLVFEPIMRHLPELTIVAKNRKVQDLLFEKGISSILWPVYPKVVIMARHSLHMFPSNNIVKIGMRHGVYNFKKFISAKKYNKFKLFFFTSNSELRSAKENGINNGIAIGFPKIDDLHNDSIKKEKLQKLKSDLGFDNTKINVLFSATWDKSGISAVEKWYDKLDKITDKFNVFVTVHPFTDQKIIHKLINTPKIKFIQNEGINDYLKIADVLVGDTSSIIGEFCSLNKPVITFNIEVKERLNPEVKEMINDISFTINDFSELIELLPYAVKNSEIHAEQRLKFNERLFLKLDGKAGKRGADAIIKLIQNEGISY